MLPEEHEIGCKCDDCTTYFKMGHPLDFINQRADKISITDVIDRDDVNDDSIVITKQGVEREVRSNTMSCPLDGCDGDGYYDQIGEVICEDCGCVISAERKPTLAIEYTGDGDSIVGESRGLEKMPGTRNSRGTREPMI